MYDKNLLGFISGLLFLICLTVFITSGYSLNSVVMENIGAFDTSQTATGAFYLDVPGNIPGGYHSIDTGLTFRDGGKFRCCFVNSPNSTGQMSFAISPSTDTGLVLQFLSS